MLTTEEIIEALLYEEHRLARIVVLRNNLPAEVTAQIQQEQYQRALVEIQGRPAAIQADPIASAKATARAAAIAKARQR